jgi:small subunit ribosomal protein S6
MNKYEMMFIVKTTLDEEAANKVSKTYEDIISSMKGKLTDSKNLGNKKLAYPIKKEATGYYYVLNFEATPEIVAEVDRKARIDESVLRHMIIRLDEE